MEKNSRSFIPPFFLKNEDMFHISNHCTSQTIVHAQAQAYTLNQSLSLIQACRIK